jgi:ubiquinone/menaquinone biosynthesis C-methylase UbiE
MAKSEKEVYYFDKQEVVLDPFETPGRILDLGGGGEGTIEQLEGERVVAIAPKYPERFIERASEGALKLVMDARELKFLDNTFPMVTSFFTIMYIDGKDHAKVFEEAYRVLQPGGRFLVWEVSVPPCQDENTEIYVLVLSIKLPNTEIETGYGHRWPGEVRDLGYYRKLAEGAGFEMGEGWEDGRALYLDLLKPENK